MSIQLSASPNGVENTGVDRGPNLRQQNVFGLIGTAWQNPATYYVPGTGNPAVSTADYYHQNGLSWFCPLDLTSAAAGSVGASIAASRGRYVWIAGPDHPSGGFVWPGGSSFILGYSNDPGILPSTMSVFVSENIGGTTQTVSNITASISGNNLTVTATSGIIYGTVTGSGVTSVNITGQTSGAYGDVGVYTIAGSPQTVASQAMAVVQSGYALYQNPQMVANPDDVSFTFYVYGEGSGIGVAHEEGMVKSADLITWTAAAPTHGTPAFSSWSSYQRVTRDGVNSWHSTGFEASYSQNGNVFGRGKFISPDGRFFMPGSLAFNPCVPSGNNSPSGSQTCTGTGWTRILIENSPELTISSQKWAMANITTATQEWVGRAPIDASYNAMSSPAPVLVSNTYSGLFPGPDYIQTVNGYIEDGIAHYYASVGFCHSSTLYNLVDGATYANGGGLWEQAIDYYTEIIDAAAAVLAAPIGVRASCASGTVTLTWYDALPQNTYRVYRGTTAGSQTTLVGNVAGTSITDTPTAGSVYYYKVVTISSATERQSRIVSTYASSSSASVNAHMTRVLAAGADATTINRSFLDTFDSWLAANGLSSNLMFATMVDCGVIKSGSNISKIMDYGCTRLPRGGDFTTVSANVTYSTTGINGTPCWIGAAGGGGYYGAGKPLQFRRKQQITVFGAYQKGHTFQIALATMGQSIQRMALLHTSGTPGAINFLLSDATQQKTATATISGLATDFHTAAGIFDGTNLIAYSDGSGGSAQTGLVIPTGTLNINGGQPDILTGQTNPNNIPMLAGGATAALWDKTSTPTLTYDAANFNGGAVVIFDKGLSSSQILSLHTLFSTRFGF